MTHRVGSKSLFNLCVNRKVDRKWNPHISYLLRKRRPYQVRVHCVGLMISHLVYIVLMELLYHKCYLSSIHHIRKSLQLSAWKHSSFLTQLACMPKITNTHTHSHIIIIYETQEKQNKQKLFSAVLHIPNIQIHIYIYSISII